MDFGYGSMRFDAITLFPQMFDAITQFGVTRRAHERGLWSLRTWNPRDFTLDPHRTVDDRPFGGGPGMVLMAEPLALAVEAARAEAESSGERSGAQIPAPRVICLSAAGQPLTDARVKQLAQEGSAHHRGQVGRSLILVCGRYEGIDQRFVERVGFYNPKATETETKFRIAQDRLAHWRSVGAQVSPTVARLVKTFGVVGAPAAGAAVAALAPAPVVDDASGSTQQADAASAPEVA